MRTFGAYNCLRSKTAPNPHSSAAFSALCLAPTNRTDLAGRADLSDQPTTQTALTFQTVPTAQTFQTVTKNDGAGGVLLKDIADAGDRPVTGPLPHKPIDEQQQDKASDSRNGRFHALTGD